MDMEKLVKDLEQSLIAAQDEVLRREGALMLARQLLAHQQAEAAKVETEAAKAEQSSSPE